MKIYVVALWELYDRVENYYFSTMEKAEQFIALHSPELDGTDFYYGQPYEVGVDCGLEET